MRDEAYFTTARERMVAEQIAYRGLREARLLGAFKKVPRHLFVSPEQRSMAYADGPLPIGQGQTISQPYIVALMTDLLALKGDETVLEVGTGSGYQAAILAHMAKQVHSIERHAELAESAGRILAELGLTNVQVHIGDGSAGLPEYAPYQGIVVTAAAPKVPQPLLEQLAECGRLVLPVGGLGGQYLECWTRRDAGYEHENIAPVAFVPLRGKHGWKNDRWGIF